MFQRLRNWMRGESGLKEAAREAAREATREGLIEGFHLGVDDFIDSVSGVRTIEVRTAKPITNGNGNGHHEEPSRLPELTAAELRGMRKPDLLELAETRGLEADESWTVAQLREQLVSS